MDAQEDAPQEKWCVLETNRLYRAYPRFDAVHITLGDPRWSRSTRRNLPTEAEARAIARIMQEAARQTHLDQRTRDIPAEACRQWERAFAGVPEVSDSEARYETHHGRPNIALNYLYRLPSGQSVHVYTRTSIQHRSLEWAVWFIRFRAGRAAGIPDDEFQSVEWRADGRGVN